MVLPLMPTMVSPGIMPISAAAVPGMMLSATAGIHTRMNMGVALNMLSRLRSTDSGMLMVTG